MRVFFRVFSILVEGQNYSDLFQAMCAALSNQQINMIEESHFLSYEEDFFSNPGSLEQLKDNLMILLCHEQNGFNSVIDGLRNISAPFQEQSFPQINLKKLYQCIQDLKDQFQQRSSNVSTLVDLSTKMIDYILDERYKTNMKNEKYQSQIEQLRSNIDYLTKTKNVIQNDVDMFRQQLQAARNQLEDIIDKKEEINENQPTQGDALQYETRRQLQKDSKIELLQVELESIKEELNFYKFNSHNRKSPIKFNEENKLFCCNSEANILYSLEHRKINHITRESETEKYLQDNKQLEEENQRLQEQIQLLRENNVGQFKLNLHENLIQIQDVANQLPIIDENQQIGNQSPFICQNPEIIYLTPPILQEIRQFNEASVIPSRQQITNIPLNINASQLLKIQNFKKGQTEKAIYLNEGRQQTASWLSRNTSLTLIKKMSQKLSQKSNQKGECISPEMSQEDVHELIANSSVNNIFQAYHCLSTEWSTKSFEANICNPIDLIRSNRAIYLTEEDNRSESSIETPFNVSLYKNIQQTKNTESSIKEFSTQEYIQAMTAKKQVTWKETEAMKLSQQRQKKIDSQKTKQCLKKRQNKQVQAKKKQPSFMDAVFDFVVRRRVRKHCKK